MCVFMLKVTRVDEFSRWSFCNFAAGATFGLCMSAGIPLETTTLVLPTLNTLIFDSPTFNTLTFLATSLFTPKPPTTTVLEAMVFVFNLSDDKMAVVCVEFSEIR